MGSMDVIKGWLTGEALSTATVLRAATLEGGLRHIVLGGEAIASLSGYEPGMELAIYVDGAATRIRRKYSVFRFHPERGEIELLVYLHGHGPGSRWAEQLVPGMPVWFRGFTGRITLDREAQNHWFLGDETTLAPFAAIVAAAGGVCEGVIEGGPQLAPLLERLWLPFTAVERRSGSSHLINMARHLDFPAAATLYIAGEAQTVAAVQQVLLHERRIDSHRIRRKNFWGDKRR